MEMLLSFLLGIMLGQNTVLPEDKPKANDSVAALAVCQGSVPERDECLIRSFKDTKEASIVRGKLAYHYYCQSCHGAEYDGKGRAAKLHMPPPTNLKYSGLPVEYVIEIVSKGGEAVGRYRGMPPWGEQLTQEQLLDVVNFLLTLRQ